MYRDVLELEIQLGELVHLFVVDVVFKLDGIEPVNMTIDCIYEIPDESQAPHNLQFTDHEMYQIRYAAADAIERKAFYGSYLEKVQKC